MLLSEIRRDRKVAASLRIQINLAKFRVDELICQTYESPAGLAKN